MPSFEGGGGEARLGAPRGQVKAAQARRAYETFLRLQPDARYADEVRRRLAAMD